MNTEYVKSGPKLVQSLSAGLQLFEYIATKRHSVSLASIVRDLQWDQSKTRRLLRTLVQDGYLVYDPLARVYMTGAKILTLTENLLKSLSVEIGFSRRFLEDLAENVMVTAALAVLRGDRAATIEVVLNQKVTSVVTFIGASPPAFCVALGKVFLAEMTPATLIRLLKHSNIEPFTPQTKTDLNEILKEMEQIRAQGYALEDREYLPGVCGVAAPVHGSMEVVASVGVLFPASNANNERIPVLAEEVKQVALKMQNNVVR